MNEQQSTADNARRDNYHRLVETFDSIWTTFSEVEKAEYKRLERNVYAFLPAYHVAADNLHKLRCDAREWWFSTDNHFRYLWPVPVVVCALLFSLDMNRTVSWMAVGVVFLLYSLVLVDELKRTRISRLMEKWFWREKEMRSHLMSSGMTSGLLDEAWHFHRKETSDDGLDRTSIEYMEFHWEIKTALLNAVRSDAIFRAATRRFVADSRDSQDSPF
jgi:hypothetical protein